MKSKFPAFSFVPGEKVRQSRPDERTDFSPRWWCFLPACPDGGRLNLTALEALSTQSCSLAKNPEAVQTSQMRRVPLAVGSCCPGGTGRKEGRPSCAPVPTGKPTIVRGCLSFPSFSGNSGLLELEEGRVGLGT